MVAKKATICIEIVKEFGWRGQERNQENSASCYLQSVSVLCFL